MVRTHWWGCASLVLAVVAGHLSTPAMADDGHIHLVGSVFMEPVDARRIVVAVTVNGSAEHFFLYTASTTLKVTPRLRNYGAIVDYDEGQRLRVTLTGGDTRSFEFAASPRLGMQVADGSIIGFYKTVALSHYVARPPVNAHDLDSLHSSDCDRSPRTCTEVAGQSLPFGG
jgi:hypothetical protein